MKAKKAIQRKMYRESSRGDVKQHIEELFKLTFFHRSGRLVWNSSAANNFFEQIVEPFELMTNFFQQIIQAVRTDYIFFSNGQTESFERIPNLGRVFHNYQ